MPSEDTYFKPGNQISKGFGAPKGNKNAEGHGRPPLSEMYDLEKEANDLLAWSKQTHSIILADFCDDKPYTRKEMWSFSKQSDYYRNALDKTMERIATRREDLAHKDLLNVNIFNRYQHNYDQWLKSCERDDKEHEYQLKKEVETAPITIEHVEKPYRRNRKKDSDNG